MRAGWRGHPLFSPLGAEERERKKRVVNDGFCTHTQTDIYYTLRNSVNRPSYSLTHTSVIEERRRSPGRRRRRKIKKEVMRL